MDRREALKALVSLPTTARISVADLKPDDVLVLEVTERLSEAQRARVVQVLGQLWPGRKCLVLDAARSLKVSPSEV